MKQKFQACVKAAVVEKKMAKDAAVAACKKLVGGKHSSMSSGSGSKGGKGSKGGSGSGSSSSSMRSHSSSHSGSGSSSYSLQRHEMQGGAGADASSMRHSGADFRDSDGANMAANPDDRAWSKGSKGGNGSKGQSTMLWVAAAGFVGIAAVALVVGLVVRRRRNARARRTVGSVLPGSRTAYVVQADVVDPALTKGVVAVNLAVGIPCSESSV
jgi:hypothetical protein